VAGVVQKQPSASRGAAAEVQSHDYGWLTLLARDPGAIVVHGQDDDGRLSAVRPRQGPRLNLLYGSSTPARGTTGFDDDFDGGRWGHRQTINPRVLDALYGDSLILGEAASGMWASQLTISDRSGTSTSAKLPISPFASHTCPRPLVFPSSISVLRWG
jgi:hypothetical protein